MAIRTELFGKNAEGRDITRYIITNARGAYAALINQGAHIQRVVMPDRDGVMGDVCLGFDEAEPYIRAVGSVGSTVGRVANRIAGGTFELDGARYTLHTNEHGHTLHGGLAGFHKKSWSHEIAGENAVRFTYVSPDGEEGFPGEVTVSVTITLDDQNALKLDYEASATKATPINLTNHAYFNLNGQGTVHDHQTRINADAVTVTDDDLIPTGAFLPVSGTPFDFIQARALREGLDNQEAYHALKAAAGYDVNYVLRGAEGELCEAAEVYAPESGRVMRVYTDQPGIQLYTANHLNTTGYDDQPYGAYSGFCLETQHYPDSVHHQGFPSTILRPGEILKTVTIYVFDAR